MSKLFSPYKIKSIEFKNRVWVSPMCQYSAEDGVPTDWHIVHLGSRAVGGAGFVMMEATAVSPEGRISPEDNGIWREDQAEAYKRITAFIRAQNSISGIQLAHAGRKAQTRDAALAPSAESFGEGYGVPIAMTEAHLKKVEEEFVEGARRALAAGFQVAEVHAAHGYLLNEFLSPLSNHRQDQYGGSFENRIRFPLRVIEAVRGVWPDALPLMVRISATDWTDGGWDLEQSVELARELKKRGVDLIDCSSGGVIPHAKIPVGPNYQVHLAEGVRSRAGIATAAVGLITEARQAEKIVAEGKADAVFLARAFLRDPYWALHAQVELDGKTVPPRQYERAF